MHWLVQVTWFLFSIASTLETPMGVSYWLVFYSTGAGVTYSINYINIMSHGGITVLILIDGLLINRIPLRIRQIIFPMAVGFMYSLWTLLHWQLDIGNKKKTLTLSMQF